MSVFPGAFCYPCNPYHYREKSSFFARIFQTRRLPVIRVYPCPSVVNPFGCGFAALGPSVVEFCSSSDYVHRMRDDPDV